jgi:hypothetical protein
MHECDTYSAIPLGSKTKVGDVNPESAALRPTPGEWL